MKRFLQLSLAFALVLALNISAMAENAKPFVVPELTSWTGADGQTALSGRILYKGAIEQPVAKALAADYEQMFGQALTVAKGNKTRPGDLSLAIVKDSKLGAEGYRLTVGASGVRIEAQTAQALFWGTRTVLQIAEQSEAHALPCGVAVDVPQYAMRGFMIDCGRKFIPLSYLDDLVKVMAYYKMNTLHVHLNDCGFKKYFGNDWMKTQAAFRLESTTYPGLAAKDGHYTKADFVRFQRDAMASYVEIIPEIDAPAHVLAFTQYRPELGSKEYGMDHFDLFNPDTYTFMDNLWKEYLEGPNPVFVGKRVHIGTDEYSNAKKEVVEKFRAYTDRYIRLVEGYGKTAMLWGALTHANGDTPVKAEGVEMSCWYNGYAQPRDMKKQGYKLISIPDGLTYIVPSAGYYYDYLNCQYLYEHYTPAVIGGETFDEQDPAILGGMFAVWNDHAGNGITVADVHHRVMPAMQTLAVKCWTATLTSLPYADWDARRAQLSEAPGVNRLGRLGLKPGTVLERAEVKAGETLPAREIGYDYSVSLTIDCAEEARGTVLFQSPDVTFYLSDPETGQLSFHREGYRNRFNYRLPATGKVTLTIEGTNKMTRLLVDGKERQKLETHPVYVMGEDNRVRNDVGGNYELKVYEAGEKMFYNPTLVFPLQTAGQFKSRVTNLKVNNYIK